MKPPAITKERYGKVLYGDFLKEITVKKIKKAHPNSKRLFNHNKDIPPVLFI
jgi:hypothetical protein